jgi:hypothetical protein
MKSLIERLAIVAAKLIPVRPTKVTINPSERGKVLSRYRDGKPLHIQIGVEDCSK